ncbi:MAG: alpha/beta fold hydrolase [Albidovulum sp.]
MAVHPALIEAAEKDLARAHAMMTGWSLAPAARIGGNAAPGMWMSGGTMALLGRGRPGVLARDLAACNAWTSASDAARRVTCPTTVIMGELDLMTPPRKARDLVGAIAGAKAVTIAGAGHMTMLEAPDATLDALLAAFSPKRQAGAA